MGFKKRSSSKESDLKTLENDSSVASYIAAIADPKRQEECQTLLRMMKKVSGRQPKMWGSSIVGFGRYHYKYASGREGDWMRLGFSSRKASLTIYCMSGFSEIKPLLKKLGPVTHSVSCLYVKKLEQIDMRVLNEILEFFWADMGRRYPD
jgi:hypothetical protein